MNKINTFFISGHRDLTQKEFDELYVPQISWAICRWISDTLYGPAKFVVGDYQGCDIMAQDYLAKIGQAENVIVYHMFDSPRNINEEVKTKGKTVGGFKSDIERDSAMTEASNSDIAFVRKGKERSGTALNIIRRFSF